MYFHVHGTNKTVDKEDDIKAIMCVFLCCYVK